MPRWPGFRWLKNAYVLIAGAGIGLFAFSFVVLGLWPNWMLVKQIAQTKPADLPANRRSEASGRSVYAREGCMTCHSQLVRFTDDDVRRFGPASQAWESRRRIAADVGHAADRPGPRPRGGPEVEGLAARPPLEPAACRPRFGDARLPVAV